MKFLIDEDVPVKLLKVLIASGHDAVRVHSSSKDPEIARQARKQDRILITLDKDFTNRLQYPPDVFSIIHIRIHPPFAEDLIAAVQKLISEIPEQHFKGLIVLQKSGHIYISE